ncbi:MAG: SAM-dependent chlorinase/fluorinase [Pseudomonadota bacterium]
MGFAASGVITLTTDYGLTDPFVGIVKGAIIARHPAARIIDLVHTLPAFEPAAAGFWLAHSFTQFPPGSVHVAIVDPGVGTARAILAVECAGQVLLAPDNGLLDRVLARGDVAAIVELDAALLAREGICARSSTFHGRDIFAPLAAEIAAGRRTIGSLGTAVHRRTAPKSRNRAASGDRSGQVAVVDRYGNLITDIEAPADAAAAGWQVEVAGRRLPLLRTYAHVPHGQILALVNSFGLVEIGCNGASAADSLGAGPGLPVALFSPEPQ